MVDLMGQYRKIKKEIDKNILNSIESGKFINGPIVKEFSENLEKYLEVNNVIPCANGTDALQIAFMTLGLKPGDEIICPSWTYIATAEAAKFWTVVAAGRLEDKLTDSPDKLEWISDGAKYFGIDDRFGLSHFPFKHHRLLLCDGTRVYGAGTWWRP